MARKLKAESATDKVKLADLMHPDFQAALSTLMNGVLPVRTSYLLVQTFESVVTHQKHFEEVRRKILDKYAKKTLDGRIEMNEQQTQYVLEDKAGFDKEYAELMAIEVEMPKVPLSYLGEVKLSPAMLSTLVRTVISPQL